MITNSNNFSLNAYSCIFAVKQNSKFFTDSEIEGVRKVRKLQQHLYWPETSNFKTYFQEVIICNCPINPEDSVRANHIYVPARLLLQGGIKCWRNTSDRIPRVPLSIYISLHHNNIKLYFDFFI